MLAEMEGLLKAKDECEGQLAERGQELRAAREEVDGLRALLGQMEEEMGVVSMENQELINLQGEGITSTAHSCSRDCIAKRKHSGALLL